LHYPPQARVLSNYRNVDTKASLKIPAMTAAALWEGPALLFGTNRKSRSCEAAGRRNWPEPCPGKCVVEKGGVLDSVQIVRDGVRSERNYGVNSIQRNHREWYCGISKLALNSVDEF
jgi:hypothetical protein